MTIPPSAPANASRAALAARLTELRTAAGLSGNALARRMGIVQSRVWKIEHPDEPPHLMPNDDDITAWAKATGREDTTADLLDMLASARGEQAFSAAFRRKGGAAAFEDRVRAAEERSHRIGEFQVAVIPGIFHTEDYARELFGLTSGVRAWGSDDADVEAKVTARLRRQEALYDHGKRIQVVVGEGALRTLVCTPGTLRGQLDKLLAVMNLPSVEFGIIAFGQPMPAYPLGFRLYDDDYVVVESTVAEHDYTVTADADKVAAYVAAFDALISEAVTGDDARRLIAEAAESLRASG